MRRNRKNSRNDVIIDLTSMLDVIFIILLVVMVGQKTVGIKNAQENDAYESSHSAAVSALNDAKELYEDAADTAKYFRTASVSVPYDEEAVHKRTAKILFMGYNEIQEISLTGNDTEKAFEELTGLLENYINENQGNPVVLSLNDDDGKILYRDEKAVTEIFLGLSESYDNVYIKGNLGEVEP